MLRLGSIAILASALAGCVTSPIPDGYTGPTATIQDTAFSESSARARFFYVAEVDGRTIKHSPGATRSANYGRGFSLVPIPINRPVPAKLLTLKLEARNAYGAPIQEIFNSSQMYTADETIEVELKPEVRYVVRGELTEKSRMVWLEEEKTGTRVGRKVQSR